MTRHSPPPSTRAQAQLRDLERMGEVLVLDGELRIRLRSGQVQVWRRVAGTAWFERVDGGEK